MRNHVLNMSSKFWGLLTALFLFTPSVWAAGPPAPSIFSNILAVSLIILMIMMALIIAILASILLGVSGLRTKQRKTGMLPIFILFLAISQPAIAQTAMEAPGALAAPEMIGGLNQSVFYTMISVLFLEMFIIIALLINIRLVINQQPEMLQARAAVEKPKGPSWWDRINKFRPATEEAELDLGHDYDGIRELNNRLPPWWLYGFYVTILFAGIYLWRFHVSHTGPGSAEEYDRSLAKAEIEVQEYLKKKGESVDENSFAWMSNTEDLATGKGIFLKSCATCHKPTGGGDVGPNLTDDYWIHGNDPKSIFKVVRYGINAMPSWQNQYSNKQIAQVISYVKTLHGSNPPGAKVPDGTLMKESEPIKDTTQTKGK